MHPGQRVDEDHPVAPGGTPASARALPATPASAGGARARSQSSDSASKRLRSIVDSDVGRLLIAACDKAARDKAAREARERAAAERGVAEGEAGGVPPSPAATSPANASPLAHAPPAATPPANPSPPVNAPPTNASSAANAALAAAAAAAAARAVASAALRPLEPASPPYPIDVVRDVFKNKIPVTLELAKLMCVEHLFSHGEAGRCDVTFVFLGVARTVGFRVHIGDNNRTGTMQRRWLILRRAIGADDGSRIVLARAEGCTRTAPRVDILEVIAPGHGLPRARAALRQPEWLPAPYSRTLAFRSEKHGQFFLIDRQLSSVMGTAALADQAVIGLARADALLLVLEVPVIVYDQGDPGGEGLPPLGPLRFECVAVMYGSDIPEYLTGPGWDACCKANGGARVGRKVKFVRHTSFEPALPAVTAIFDPTD